MLELFRNAPIKVPLNFTNNEFPTDITGWTVHFYVCKNLGDGQILINKAVSSHLDAAKGLSEIEFTKAELSLPAGDYYYEIAVNDGVSGELPIEIDLLKLQERVNCQV